MKKFYMIVNRIKDPQLQMAKKIAGLLEANGASCVIQADPSASYAVQADPSASYAVQADPSAPHAGQTNLSAAVPPDMECVLVLGGDGTVLRAARDLVSRQIPFFGINLGTLGYLSEIGADGVETALPKLLLDEYVLEERMMLKGEVYHHDACILSGIALNDIVIARSGRLRVMDFHILVNGRFLNAYSADGIVVATPTGSTAYSLSVGGPIVSPAASLMLVTPVAPHTLTSRSVILPDDVTVRVEIGERAGSDETAEATFDGDTTVKMRCGDYIEIRKSGSTVQFVKIDQVSFLEILRRKMSGK